MNDEEFYDYLAEKLFFKVSFDIDDYKTRKARQIARRLFSLNARLNELAREDPYFEFKYIQREFDKIKREIGKVKNEQDKQKLRLLYGYIYTEAITTFFDSWKHYLYEQEKKKYRRKKRKKKGKKGKKDEK